MKLSFPVKFAMLTVVVILFMSFIHYYPEIVKDKEEAVQDENDGQLHDRYYFMAYTTVDGKLQVKADNIKTALSDEELRDSLKQVAYDSSFTIEKIDTKLYK